MTKFFSSKEKTTDPLKLYISINMLNCFLLLNRRRIHHDQTPNYLATSNEVKKIFVSYAKFYTGCPKAIIIA